MDDEYLYDDEEDNLFVSFKTSVNAIRVIDRELLSASIRLRMDIANQDVDTTQDSVFRSQVAMAKMRYWLDECLSNSVMFSRDNDWAVNTFLSTSPENLGTSNPVTILPGDPTEDLLVQVIQSKLQSLVGSSMTIGNVELEIEDGHGLMFTYVGDGELELPTNEEWVGEHCYFGRPWWCRDDASTMDIIAGEDDDVEDLPSFAYSLEFLADALRPSTAPSAQIVRPDFRPHVIQGGRED